MRQIVVGLDGSPAAWAALSWSARLAEDTGATLCGIAAWHYPSPIDEWQARPSNYGYLPIPPTRDGLRQLAQSIAEDAREEICTQHPTVASTWGVVEAPAATALVEASADADLLVVGRNRHARLAEMALGSVSHTCARHAACPVVVVPPPVGSPPRRGRATGPGVVWL